MKTQRFLVEITESDSDRVDPEILKDEIFLSFCDVEDPFRIKVRVLELSER